MFFFFFFFFKQKTAYEITEGDWSSDVCSSDLHRPKIELRIEPGLVDFGPDFDAPIDARWIRGSITNIGDGGLQRCRLKLLRIKGPNLPPNANRLQNGFLQWQGGIRDSMRLNRGERWIFDIGSRRDIQNAPMRPFTHFV